MDPIADLLTSIRNGYLTKKSVVTVPFSVIKGRIVDILVTSGFVKSSEKIEGDKPSLKLTLHYMKNGKPVLTGIKRIAKPSVRIYADSNSIPRTPGAGVTIVTTSGGVMTDSDARSKNLGGEVICQVW